MEPRKYVPGPRSAIQRAMEANASRSDRDHQQEPARDYRLRDYLTLGEATRRYPEVWAFLTEYLSSEHGIYVDAPVMVKPLSPTTRKLFEEAAAELRRSAKGVVEPLDRYWELARHFLEHRGQFFDTIHPYVSELISTFFWPDQDNAALRRQEMLKEKAL